MPVKAAAKAAKAAKAPKAPKAPKKNPGVRISLQKPATELAFELPKATVEILGQEGFKIQLERLRSDNLQDQGRHLLISRGQGCISSPTGPTC